MKHFPNLFKRTTNGSVQQWQIVVEGDSFYTIEGLLDGKLTTSKYTVCEGKNIGKGNETTSKEQAELEAAARFKKQLKQGYTENIEDIDTCLTYFKPMLCHKYVEYKDKIEFPVLVSRKIDGFRLIARKDGCWTRKGEVYVSVPHISKILKPVFDKHPNYIIDGEVYSHEVPFEKIASLVRKTKPTPEDIIESEKYCKFFIFDGVTDDLEMDFNTRFTIIQKEIENLVKDRSMLVFVENFEVNSHEEVQKYHDKFVEEGFEGLILRVKGQSYANKRTKNILKYKEFFDEEFEIVDILEGVGNRSGMAGKIVFLLKSGETCESGIRGGETYYKELLKNRKKLIGKKVTVRYQGFTEKGSLRFPVAINIDPFDK